MVFLPNNPFFISACPTPFSSGPGVFFLMQFYDRTPGTIVSGTSVPDLSGSGHHGTMSANALFIRSSDSCQAVGLYVNAGGIAVPNVPSLRVGVNITLEIWVKATKLGYGYVALFEDSYGFPRYEHGKFYVFVDRNEGQFFTAFDDWDLELHYYVLVVAHNETKVYIDGRFVLTGKIHLVPS